MDYKVLDIEGVGEEYAKKLNDAGIFTTSEYLSKTATPALRKKLAEETKISPKLILKFANHADLIRINGIGPQYAEILERAGVDTVNELKNRVPANLAKKVVEINEEKHLAKRSPTLKNVEKWVEEAKTLKPALTY